MNDEFNPVETFRRAVGAAMRAISEKDEVTVQFSSGPSAMEGNTARLPLPSRDLRPWEIAKVRGQSDALALKLRYHNEKTHHRMAPPLGEPRAVFDALEQARIEALGANRMRGVARNLTAALEDYCLSRGFPGIERREQAPLADAVRCLAREHFTGEATPEAAQKMLNFWRSTIESKAGAELMALAKCLDDQAAFAKRARHILADLGLIDEPGPEEDEPYEEESEENLAGEESPADSEGESTTGEDFQQFSDPDQGEDGNPEAAMDTLDEESDSDMHFGDAGDVPGEPGRPKLPKDSPQPDAPPYRPYTTAFDETVPADHLCEPDEKMHLRTQLDHKLAQLKDGVTTQLANRLQRLLQAKQTRSWEFDLEEGVLDASRLARVIVNPTYAISYKQETEMPFRDTIVSLLIDNSGSMRGRPITVAAMSAEVLSRTLERCGVKTEVLGFTTCAWKGGKSREKWIADGNPQNPGRLNDLLHIVYKAADEPWRRARNNFGIMLKEGLLKENIDGEALLWAHQRLMARPEQRRILMVISDGAPVDDSTLTHNPGNCLERHLRQVIDWIEQRSDVQLLAIGIAHDVTRYYRRAVTIFDASQLGGTMVEKLAELFEDVPDYRPVRRRVRRAQSGERTRERRLRI
ncbi:MAG: cobaltochelatase subunit CobT [Alphaproteobacteria bacterium]|nr:cobaltochelatase subunit CobT [Alphaproteobacteria bacterium]